VVVSHDRYFLDRTVDRLFCFEDGRLQRFEGNYSAYLERQQGLPRAEGAAADPSVAEMAPAVPAPTPAKSAAKPRRRSFKENRELAELETNLPAWEARRTDLEAQLAGGTTAAAGDYTALERLSAELSELLQRIEQGEERWLELSELAG